MKRVIYIIAVFVMLSIILESCSQWGGNNPVGVLGGGETGYGEYDNIAGIGGESENFPSIVGSWRHNFSSGEYTIIKFFSNGRWESHVYEEGILNTVYIGSFSISGNKLTIIASGESFTITYSINDDKLTLVFPDGSIVYFRI